MEESSYKDNYPDYIETEFEFTISPGQGPERIDKFLTRSVINATRTKVQKAIAQGNVTINNKIAKASQKIQPGDLVVCKIMKAPPIELIAENIPLNIAYEDDSIVVVNKSAGMVCHPGFGNRYGTLVNGIMYYLGYRGSITIDLDDEDEELDEGMIYASDSIRPGLVHRLDKDTSGLVLITKKSEIHPQIAEQFADRTISRTYITLVWGKFDDDQGSIISNIGRSARDRKLFDVVQRGGKYAATDYEVIERLGYLTLLKVKLRTGRTHQIRVHFKSISHPVFGDQSYGGNSIIYGSNDTLWKRFATQLLNKTKRQLLHASELSFYHPEKLQSLTIKSDLPEDFQSILTELKYFFDESKS